MDWRDILGYSSAMRFRDKNSGVFAGMQLFMALTDSVEWVRRGRLDSGLNKGSTVFFIFSSLFWISLYLFRYWEIEADSLRERNFWKSTSLPWDQVFQVKVQPATNSIEVRAYRPPPMSERFHLSIQPARREKLIAALRSQAPQAEFDV